MDSSILPVLFLLPCMPHEVGIRHKGLLVVLCRGHAGLVFRPEKNGNTYACKGSGGEAVQVEF